MEHLQESQCHMFAEQEQPRKHGKADLDQAPQCASEPTSTHNRFDLGSDSIPDHPAAFSFPTLSPDGSVDDITLLPTRSYAPTPPAALSSLGARSRDNMAEQNAVTDSTSSFADSQYDMVDDLSEISNDDHDTASLASTEHAASDDGIVTPEDDISEADDKQETTEQDDDQLVRSLTESEDDMDDHQPGDTPHRSTTLRTPWGRVKLENEVLDSYLSEDLDTPRQSTLPLLTHTSPQAQPEKQLNALSSLSGRITSVRPLRILLIAEHDVPEAEKSQLCAKITSALAGCSNASNCYVTALPETPSGIAPSSAITYFDDGVQIEVQHCVGAATKMEPENPNSVHSRSKTWTSIHLLDANGEHSSVYRVGQGLKPEFEKPDMALIYDVHAGKDTTWITTAQSAMSQLKVPTLVIDGVDVRDDIALDHYDLYADEILEMDSQELRAHLDNVLSGKPLCRDPAPSTTEMPKRKQSPISLALSKARKWDISFWASIFRVIAISLLVMTAVPHLRSFFSNPIAENAVRREALSSAVFTLTNSTDATKAFNIDHVLPQPTATTTDFFGRQLYNTPDQVHHAILSPNHVIVSVPKKSGFMSYRRMQSVRAHKGSRDVACNQTRIIDGVYDIVIDATEAHGVLDVEGVMTNPNSAFTIQHNFGNRLLQRQTYGKARTDISKSMTKDISLASNTVKTLGERLQLELIAGAAATKNVTTQLAVQMTHDLQIFVNAAASMVGKVDQAISKTASAIVKDIAVIQKDVVNFGKSVQKSLGATTQTAKTLAPTKKTVTSPLKLSHERAVGFRQKLLGGKRNANSTSSTKELSTRVHDFVKSLTPANKWANSLLPKSGPNSLSTVPGEGVTSQKTCGKKTSARDAKARQSIKRDRAMKQADAELMKAKLQKKSMGKTIPKQSAQAESTLQRARERAAKLACGA